MDTARPLDFGVEETETKQDEIIITDKLREIPKELYNKYIGLVKAIDADYFITITFRPGVDILQGHYKPTAQLNETRREVCKLLKASCRFMVIPEMTLQGRIHYHAIIKIEDKIKWHRQTMPAFNKWGRFDIQKIKNIDNVYRYLLKENVEYCEIFNKSYIVYHNGTQFKYTEDPINEVKELSKCINKYVIHKPIYDDTTEAPILAVSNGQRHTIDLTASPEN